MESIDHLLSKEQKKELKDLEKTLEQIREVQGILEEVRKVQDLLKELEKYGIKPKGYDIKPPFGNYKK